MIELTNVTYSYSPKDRPALNHLSLSVAGGEAVCIMGANGSGKSTLAAVLAGLLEPQGGRVNIEASKTSPLPVGILFQNPDNQMVAVTVEKEIAFALENLGLPLGEMETRINQTLERFRISHLRRRLTAELSGGEKQRVALASVMVLRPPILVLDEPDSFLDEAGKRILVDELAGLKKSAPSLTEIRITQYPQVARSYSRLIVLDRGGVAADGDPKDILSDIDLCHRTGLKYVTGEENLEALERSESLEDKPSALRLVSDRLGFSYGDGDRIIDDLSLELRPGETLGVVGPSGSGKSTLGLLLCGLLRPTSGGVSLLNGEGRPIPAARTRGWISGLFQQPERQFFLPTCVEEIAFGPHNLGRELTPAETERLFQMVGLDAARLGRRDPFSLSGGEKRRLAFAAVLSMAPRFVIFDEPTCGLDQDGVGRFIQLVQSLKQNSVGSMIITHDGDIINALAERVLLLSGDGHHKLTDRERFFTDPTTASVVSPLTEGHSSVP